MTTRKKRTGDLLISNSWFRKKARTIIDKMSELNKQIQDKTQTSVFVDEILHSILFLGQLYDPSLPPEQIVNDGVLKSRYPLPFQLYSTQLPKRSPFSCVLDMMVHLVGQENEEEIRNRLKRFITEVEGGVPSEHSEKKGKNKVLISTAICVSQNTATQPNNSVRHYGVSMSTSGRIAGRIVIAASCLSAWDDYVAGAVMTYYPKKSKKSYFDGTIKIPEDVRCKTFNLKSGREMIPCKSCGDMFGFSIYANEENDWLYGNCAEAESLSNLLQIEAEVKEQTQRIPNMWTSENIDRAREEVLNELKSVLHRINFNTWDDEFYTPQSSIA